IIFTTPFQRFCKIFNKILSTVLFWIQNSPAVFLISEISISFKSCFWSAFLHICLLHFHWLAKQKDARKRPKSL
ncbi:MAG: hypothetical protein ACLSFJ_14420, partial [Holdemania filiformis]